MEEGFPKGDAAALFDQYVEGYVANHFNVEKYSRVLNSFLQHLPSHSIKLLDIACGPGNLTHYVLSHRPDATVLGIDLSPKMVEAAKIHNPSATFQVLDIRDTQQIEGLFDGILFGFGLPYLAESEGKWLLKDIGAKLSPKGILFISATLGNHEAKMEYSSKGDGLWQFLWGEKELRKFLQPDFSEIDSQILSFQYGERPPVQELIGVFQAQ